MRWKVGWHDLKSNGIRVYYFCDSGGTTHICGVGFRVGSVHDPPDVRGIAHFDEHLVSRESFTYDGDEVYRIIRRYLGDSENNVKIETDATSTYYGGLGLFYRWHMHKVMPMLVSLVRDRIITQAGIGTEGGAVNNEIPLIQEDVALAKLDILFYQTMYETNPIRFSVLGTEDSLGQITAGKARRFVKKFYVAENMFALIFGPTMQESMSFAEKYLDDWPYHGSPAIVDLKSFDLFPEITSPRFSELIKNGLRTYYVQLGFATERYISEDDANLDVIADIVHNRITDILRENNKDPKKGVYRSPGFIDRSLVHGTIGAWFSSIDKDYAFYGRDRVLKEFLRLKEELVPGMIVEETVAAKREAFMIKFRNAPEQVIDLVVKATSNGDPDLTHLHSYPDRLHKVTNKTIRKTANKYFKPDSHICVMLMPA